MQLADLLNLSFVTGIFLSVLKTAKVIPVFKKDSKLDYSYYGPTPCYQILRKYFKNLCIKDFILFSITIILYIAYNLVSVSIILHLMP